MFGPTHETWLEKTLREATERGEFDDLPGKGKPIPDLDRPYDPAWWARKFAHRERLRDRLVDMAAMVRRELPGLMADRDRKRARARVAELNAQIAELNEQLDPEDRMQPIGVFET